MPVVTAENLNLPACQLVKCCSIARFAFEKTATKTEIEIEKHTEIPKKKTPITYFEKRNRTCYKADHIFVPRRLKVVAQVKSKKRVKC